MIDLHLSSTRLPSFLVLTALAAAAGTGVAQAPADEESLRAGRFDGGKMWTFEYPPAQ